MGRCRHLLTDTNGFLLGRVVAAAGMNDRTIGRPLVAAYAPFYPRLTTLFVDGQYDGGFDGWVQAHLGWKVIVVHTPEPDADGHRGSATCRWVRERTNAWMGLQRRLSRDYEMLPQVEEAWLDLAMIRLLVRRLTSGYPRGKRWTTKVQPPHAAG